MLKFEFITLPQETLEVKHHLQENWLSPNATLTLKILYFLAKIILFPKTAFYNRKFNKGLSSEEKQSIQTVLLIDEDGIISRSSEVESDSEWSGISKWAETANTFYFLSMRSKGETGYVYILPKRIVKDAERLILKDLIKQNLKEPSEM